MATRTAYAGTAAAGDIYTAANHTKMPGGWLAWLENTTDKVTTSTTELTIFTQAMQVGANRRLRIMTSWYAYTLSVAGDVFALRGYLDGVAIARMDLRSATTAFITGGNHTWHVSTTTAGSRTIAVTLQRISGTGTATLQANATGSPSQFLVEDIGPAS